MINTIIIDFSDELKKESMESIEEWTGRYHVIDGTDSNEMLSKGECIVLTDHQEASIKWKEFPIIGVEQFHSIKGINYVAENVTSIDDDYMDLVYARFHKLPLTVARGERVYLRESCVEDVESLVSLYKDIEYVQYTKSMGVVAEEQEKMALYQKYMYDFWGYGLWTLVESATGKVIGRVGIENCEIAGLEYRELGYIVGKDYARKGYGYEACKLVLEWAKEHDINTLITRIHKNNTPSLALARKLGFKPMNLAPTKDGVSEDLIVLVK